MYKPLRTNSLNVDEKLTKDLLFNKNKRKKDVFFKESVR